MRRLNPFNHSTFPIPLRRRDRRRGFTLFELLAVIVVLGVMAAIIVPQFGGGGERTKLVVAARSLVQATRYARSMAMLHQSETELRISPSSGLVEVRAAGVAGQRPPPPVNKELAADDVEGQDGEAVDEGVIADDERIDSATSRLFDAGIDVRFENEGISFEFVEYTDSAKDDSSPGKVVADGEDDEAPPFSIVFQNNGLCRPCRIKALTEGGDALVVSIDAIGRAKIEEYGDEE